MQVVVKADIHVPPHRGHGQLLMPLARAMHDHIGVRPGAVDHAIVDELAVIVQHGRRRNCAPV